MIRGVTSVIILLLVVGGAAYWLNTDSATSQRQSNAAPTAARAVATIRSPARENAIPSLEESQEIEAGQLIMIDQQVHPKHQIVKFDLETEELTSLFEVPRLGWVYQLDVSANGRQIAFAYSAPPEGEMNPYDRSGIYHLALNSPISGPVSEPTLLVGSTTANEYYYNPIWSPDGRSLYYVLYQVLPSDASNSQQNQSSEQKLRVLLQRYDLETKERILIAQDGIWPRIAPNGEYLVYIQVEPESKERGLYLVDAQGTEVRELISVGHFFDIDTPIFSPDGEWVYFGAVPHPSTLSQSWWHHLGIKSANAHTDHDIPAEWWRVSVVGGEPERVSEERHIIFYGAFDQNQNRLLFSTATGVYSMGMDGLEIEKLPLRDSYKIITWTD